MAAFVAHYNQVRLHSALGYITPEAKLAGLESMIFAERDRKLEEARCLRLGTPRSGTQRKASGVQGAAMSPLVARAEHFDSQTRPAEGETNHVTNILNPLMAHSGNSISR